MTTKLTTLAAVGVRPAEIASLSRFFSDVLELLGASDKKTLTRVHPVAQRVCITFEDSNPVKQFEAEVNTDGKILKNLLGSVSRSHRTLLMTGELSDDQWRDFAVSLTVLRVFVSWKLGFLNASDKQSEAAHIVKTGETVEVRAALAWLWSGLVLSRIVGESTQDDPDFGL